MTTFLKIKYYEDKYAKTPREVGPAYLRLADIKTVQAYFSQGELVTGFHVIGMDGGSMWLVDDIGRKLVTDTLGVLNDG